MYQPIDAFSQNLRLARGVNIIGYDPIWQSRDNARIQPKHFGLIRRAGFSHVRINLHPFKFMGEAPEYAVPQAWFDTLDWAVEQCETNGLLAILDMHEFSLMGKDPEKYKPMFLAFWRQLAQHCKDMPQSVLFEMLNEPNGVLTAELWNGLLREPLAIIREANPERTVIVGPANWNGFKEVEKLELPEEDRHIIVTVHYYHPMPFTHQGAPWTPENVDTGVTWLGLPGEVEAIRRDFDVVQAWAKAHDRPIFLGEFGAYDRGGMLSRARYTATVARAAERLGWSWSYWQFDSDFIVYDVGKDCWVEPILDALIPNK